MAILDCTPSEANPLWEVSVHWRTYPSLKILALGTIPLLWAAGTESTSRPASAGLRFCFWTLLVSECGSQQVSSTVLKLLDNPWEPQTLLGGLGGSDYSHDNTETSFAFFAVLINTLTVQMVVGKIIGPLSQIQRGGTKLC